MLFFVALVLAILGFVLLTVITAVGVLKRYWCSEHLYLSQLICGIVGATAGAYVKPLIIGPVSSPLVFLVEWVEMLLATYAYGWLVWYATGVVQERIQERLDRMAMTKH